jgi:hypothetical protein
VLHHDSSIEINVLWPAEPPLKCPQCNDVGEVAASTRGYAEIFSYVGNHWQKLLLHIIHIIENGYLK